MTRKVFEAIFKRKFPRVRPTWLKGKHNANLELDGYSQKLGLAFEYQGSHHFREDSYSRMKKMNLTETKQRDELKSKLCKKHGITLVKVAQFKKYSVEYIINQIEQDLVASGVKLKNKIKPSDIALSEIYTTDRAQELTMEATKIAKNRRGTLLNKISLAREPLKLRCQYGHIWKTRLAHLKSGHWCRTCGHKKRAEKRRRTIQDVRNIAKKYEFACLDNRYTNAKAQFNFKCKNGHKLRLYVYDLKYHKCVKCKKEKN